MNFRRLAIFVDMPGPGRFHWVIMENESDAVGWVDLVRGEQPFLTWSEAFDEGCVELHRWVPDERRGPTVQ